MVFPLETTINHSCKWHVTYTVILSTCSCFPENGSTKPWTMDKRSRRGASASQADADGNGPCDTTAAAIDAALAEQKRSFEMLLDVQLKAFQSTAVSI